MRRYLGLILAFAIAFVPNVASGQNVQTVRDAEIEALVADYARPLLKAAGLRDGEVEIILVRNNSFNAFVAGRRMFINTGTFLAAETPNEIIAVLAHEIGHIAGGHQERLRAELERTKTKALVATLAGMGAAIAGAAAGSEGLSRAGQGVAMGGPEVARRGLLAYKRTEETAADRAAVRYLEATGQSPIGLKRTFERFEKDRALNASQVNPYLLSHPLPRERIAQIDALVQNSPNRDKTDPAGLRARHDRARAKIAAYTAGPGAATRLLAKRDATSRAYGEAIDAMLRGRYDEARARIDLVTRSLPNDPYVHEMKGEILLNSGRANEAVESFRRALRLNGDRSAILRAQIGAALLATNDPTRFADAIANLKRASIGDRTYAKAQADLARAYSRIGDSPAAYLATAEAAFAAGNEERAHEFARRAQRALQSRGPEWRRAQDILDAT